MSRQRQVSVGKVEEEPSSSYLWPCDNRAPLLFIIVSDLHATPDAVGVISLIVAIKSEILNNQQKRVTFKDVAGVEEARKSCKNNRF